MTEPLIRRRATAVVREALSDTRVVLLRGPRQAGKSTLVTRLLDLPDPLVRTLDDADMRSAALADPIGFVASDRLLVIDEIQRAPELLLAIKAKVDSDPRPGQVLLTGSARVLTLRTVADALPGRVETVDLWPLSQGEIEGTPDGFLEAVFRHGPDIDHTSDLSRTDYAERVVRGGFPEAQRRTSHRLTRFFDNYTLTLISRDVADLATIERKPQLTALLPMLAARSGSALAVNGLANQLGIAQPTVARYLATLEDVFLISRIPAWSRNVSTRATAAPKVFFVDSGVAANLLGADVDTLAAITGPLGPLLEGFVIGELQRQASFGSLRPYLSHYRTKDGVEVDVVAADRSGRVVGLEVKASATVRAEDFRGLRHLDDRIGDDLVAGIVLHTGSRTVPFGPKFRAVPISALWQMSAEGGAR